MTGIHPGNGTGSLPRPPGAPHDLRTFTAPARVPRIEVRVVQSPHLLDQLDRDRRAVYAAMGIQTNDGPLEAIRRFGTTLGLFVDGRLVGGFSAWRLSEGLLSLGYLLRGVEIEKYPPDRIVELGSMFVLPEYSGKGYVRALLEAGRVLVAGMRPQLIVAFAVPWVKDRYVEQCGFRPVGPFVPHPLTPQVQVMPLVCTWEDAARNNFA